QHFFEDIAVADGGARESDAFARENSFEPEIGHRSSHDAVSFEFVLRLEMARGRQENSIAVDDLSGFANEESAVGIAVEGHAKLGALTKHALLQAVEMQGAATRVDITAVGRDPHRDDVGA